jgi:inorganic pyrophosphatase
VLRTNKMPQEIPKLEVIIEIPRGCFLKRCSSGQLDFISPIPCPFNYGSVEKYWGLDGDLLDAIVLGPRLRRGTKIIAPALGAVRLIDGGMPDDKIICSNRPIGAHQRFFILLFFHLYAKCKGVLNFFRGRPGRNACMGWLEAGSAIAKAKLRPDTNGEGPSVPY